MDKLSLNTLRQRGTRKWTVHDDDVLPAWIAESDFPTCAPVKAAIQDCVDKETFGYTPAESGLPQAVSDFYAQRYGWRPQADHIFWVPDVVRGLTLAVKHMTRPESPVVVPVPAYPPFLEIPLSAGREKLEVSAENRLDLAAIEEHFRAGAGSILLCNPYNPLGYVFREEELTALVDLADRYDARIIADEIHAPLVLDGHHIPVAGLSEKAARICITVTAASKAWNIAGLKCAQIIFSQDDDATAWNELDHVSKDGTGTLGVIASEAAYRDGVDFVDEEVELLRENRDRLVEELPKRVPELKTSDPHATYLLWLDFRETAIAADPAGLLVKYGRVALNDGRSFGHGGAGFARLNFATTPEILDEVIERIDTGVRRADEAGEGA